MPRATKRPRAEPLTPLTGKGRLGDEIDLGRISGMFGFKGELRVFLHNPMTETFDEPRRVVLVRPDGARFEATMTIRPGAGKRILGLIEGLEGREAAEALMGYSIFVSRAALPEPEEDDEFYVTDVLGWPVFLGERQVGTVAGIHPTPGGDVLEIDTGGEPEFVLMNERFIEEFDFERERVVLTEHVA